MEGSSIDQPPYDIENPHIPLVTSMRKQLDSLSPLSSDCCIYRVPERLRHVSEKAYTPRVVSIGPFHHGKEGLKSMEEHKKRYLQDFLSQTKVSLEDYVKKIKDQEAKLRRSYAETLEFSSDEFVTIIIVDAAFIIELLLKYSFPELRDENDRIFNKPLMLQDVWPDLQLLENQLPFFILEDLYDPEKIRVSFTSKDTDQRLSIINLCFEFFTSHLHIEGVEDNLNKISKVEHFVDFIRSLCLPMESEEAGGPVKTVTTPSTTELHRAGVKFKVGAGKNLFHIQFSDGILEIPKLTIGDATWLTIRNLIAFEQCQCIENYVYDYVFIIRCFANTPKDVKLLEQYGILEKRLCNSSEGCTLINNLADGVTMNPNHFCFAALCEDLNKYCRRPWHKWRAQSIKHFFNSPWATKEIIAVVTLITLTLIQAVSTVISASRG